MGVFDRVVNVFEGKKTAQLDITPSLTREEILTCALGGSFKSPEQLGKEAAVNE